MGNLIAMVGFIMAALAILGQEFPREISATAMISANFETRVRSSKIQKLSFLNGLPAEIAFLISSSSPCSMAKQQ
jgi:hypothetical protein